MVYNSLEDTKSLIESTDVLNGRVKINLIDDKDDDEGVGVFAKEFLGHDKGYQSI